MKEYDDLMKDIFNKRMSILEQIISFENNTSKVIIPIKDKENNKYEHEYTYFLKNLLALDKNYKYKTNLKQIDNFEIECITKKIDVQTVCYPGLPFSYSEGAAKSLFKDKTYINKTSFEDVFKEVYNERAEVGVVPIENSTAGYVNDVYDLLLKYDLYINYNYVRKVDHCLAGTIDSCIEDIKEVYSHPQAIMQCKDYIKENNLTAINETNTAVAAQKIYLMDDKNVACICSPEAVENYGLKILKDNINSNQNYTRFGAISKQLLADECHNRISIVFSVPHEKGTLESVLSLFSYYNINLSYIYSRPDLKSPWKYLFYMDFEGNILDDEIKTILYQLSNELPFLKILGSFEA
jgi:chorismate mutase/prephenate dehydratase